MSRHAKSSYILLGSKNLFTISIIVIVITLLGVYFWGLGSHHTFFENGIISTTILSLAFFLFITIGLYKGVKLKDEIGSLTANSKLSNFDTIPDASTVDMPDIDFFDVGEGCIGAIIGVILWILVAFFLSIVLWLFGQIIWLVLLAFIGMLYWIFFRALRLVFKHSGKCRAKLTESIQIGLLYTIAYNFWIYGIFLLAAYLKK